MDPFLLQICTLYSIKTNNQLSSFSSEEEDSVSQEWSLKSARKPLCGVEARVSVWLSQASQLYGAQAL